MISTAPPVPTYNHDNRPLPVSLDDLKEHLRLEHNDQDRLLLTKIQTAVDEIEQYIGRSIIHRAWTLRLDEWPTVSANGSTSVLIPNPPLVSVTSVKYQDVDDVQQTIDAADYRVVIAGLDHVISPASTWPTVYAARGVIEISYVAGYASDASMVPFGLREAVIQRAATRHEHATEIGFGGGMWELSDDLQINKVLSPYVRIYV